MHPRQQLDFFRCTLLTDLIHRRLGFRMYFWIESCPEFCSNPKCEPPICHLGGHQWTKMVTISSILRKLSNKKLHSWCKIPEEIKRHAKPGPTAHVTLEFTEQIIHLIRTRNCWLQTAHEILSTRDPRRVHALFYFKF